jgi:hypothetical protein
VDDVTYGAQRESVGRRPFPFWENAVVRAGLEKERKEKERKGKKDGAERRKKTGKRLGKGR